MAFREVAVTEIREVLRAWLSGAGLRRVAEQAGVDRKTARRYVAAAAEAGLARDGGPGQLTDELVGQVAEAVRPVRPGGHGRPWDQLEACQGEIAGQVKAGLSVVKIGVLLERRGITVPYRTLHRFCVERCGFGRTAATVRVADGEPGAECQIDFGYLGLLADPVTGRQRKVHALIFTAVLFAAHVRVAVLHPDAGRAGRRVRGGVGVLRRRVQGPGPRQRLGDRRGRRRGEPAVHRGLAGLRPALRVRHRRRPGPLAEGQAAGGAGGAVRPRELLRRRGLRRPVRCAGTGRRRGAGTWPGCGSTAPSRRRPAEVFAEHEAAALLPLPLPYDVPVFTRVKVHRDFHVEIGRACIRRRRSTWAATWTPAPIPRW